VIGTLPGQRGLGGIKIAPRKEGSVDADDMKTLQHMEYKVYALVKAMA
jgi:hypothetical protein